MPKRREVAPVAAPTRETLHPFVGQQHVLEYFRRLGREQLAHAYLFSGDRGVGKRTFATMLAMTLHCERPNGFPIGYCGTCGACRRGLAGSCGDTILVDLEFIRETARVERKTDALHIDASRRIIELMQLQSYEGGRLVCIIPDFDNVTPGDYAYNALLKELEEPSAGKLFLLTAHRPDRVLPTIRSRACCIRFGPLSEDEIAGQLERYYGQPAQHARVLARRAQGSLGEAIREFDESVMELREATRTWCLQTLQSPKRTSALPRLSRDNAREEAVEVLRDARLVIRDLLMLSLGQEEQVLDRESLPQYKAASAELEEGGPAKLVAALSSVNEAARIADETNIPPATVLGWLQVQLKSA